MKKQELIEKYLSEPIKAGVEVYVKGMESQDKNAWSSVTKVIKVEDEGQEFMYEDSYYYPNTQTALKKYLDLVLLEESTDVKHCIQLIEETYNKIAKLA